MASSSRLTENPPDPLLMACGFQYGRLTNTLGLEWICPFPSGSLARCAISCTSRLPQFCVGLQEGARGCCTPCLLQAACRAAGFRYIIRGRSRTAAVAGSIRRPACSPTGFDLCSEAAVVAVNLPLFRGTSHADFSCRSCSVPRLHTSCRKGLVPGALRCPSGA